MIYRTYLKGMLFTFKTRINQERMNFSVFFDLFRQLTVCQSVTMPAMHTSFDWQFTRYKFKDSAKKL